MGSLGAAIDSNHRRPRFLCLHGFRTSGAIMRSQVVGKWPEEVISRLDLVFPDAPFPAEGKSDVEGIFSPPYYEVPKVKHLIIIGGAKFQSPAVAEKAYASAVDCTSLHFLAGGRQVGNSLTVGKRILVLAVTDSTRFRGQWVPLRLPPRVMHGGPLQFDSWWAMVPVGGPTTGDACIDVMTL
ncbi:hypothetical protein B296_00046123 [Ensete ventricosum]|uniref:Serine hydrolase domain-containing protein n=1 Tax=Ensete ventricosum TaxID=4639 RepID=A0A426Z538_ENSVE|nr:hypothetical protein B296_00046123 [Ensete ventricosum]